MEFTGLDFSTDLEIFDNQIIINYTSHTGSELIRVPLMELSLLDNYNCNGVILTDLVEILLPPDMQPLIGDTWVFEGNTFHIVELGEPQFNDCWRAKSVNLYSHNCLTEELELHLKSSMLNHSGRRILSYEEVEKTLLGRIQIRRSDEVIERGGRRARHTHDGIVLEDWEPVAGAQIWVNDGTAVIVYEILSVKAREHVAEATILELELKT